MPRGPCPVSVEETDRVLVRAAGATGGDEPSDLGGIDAALGGHGQPGVVEGGGEEVF